MAVQPPRFGERRTGAAKPAVHAGRFKHKRIRGRAGVKLRKQVRDEEPLCRLCLAEGRTRATEQVDHIVPLSRGGSNERSNFQGLCKPHHDAKSASERR
ncbi:HNH endonuclease [Sphingomonas sp. ABOLF]|uniref:HNH endonuclease n=1 Tax=Sphingomonas sp. ABOLF TaxID=1985879 RepID=UPI000F7E6422|nr:HNH endonuclease signature motif containing protein [Sphingomonas sp. ABOLF]RSV15185.1 HNH endonuclease [Sphingomonas sp. ABOLF]